MDRYDDKDRKAKERLEKARSEAVRKSAISKTYAGGERSPTVMTKEQAAGFERLRVPADKERNHRQRFSKSVDDLLSATGYLLKSRDKSHVTTFSGWVYSLYNHPQLSSAEREQRRKGEYYIDYYRDSKLNEHRTSFVEEAEPTGWKLFYKHFGRHKGDPLKISALKLPDGSCMFGKPDIVLYKRKSKKFLIIEVKSSLAPVPSDGWPNLWSQLWAYSNADLFKNANEVFLKAEVYDRRELDSPPEKLEFVNDQAFRDENWRLFSEYREVVVQEDDQSGN